MRSFVRARQLGLGAFAAVVVPFAHVLAAGADVQPESVGISSERLERIDELVQRAIDAGEIAGAVTLVARNGKIAHLAAHGVSDLATKKPMQTDTIFRIASMSKPVAAAAIMLLVEEGKVRLNDPVSRFLPDFAGAEVAMEKTPAGSGAAGPSGQPPELYAVPATRDITVLDLLTHTSGLMSGRLSNASAQPAFARRNDGVAWTEGLADAALEFQPGTRWAYSAVAGFDLLSRIVEVASGQSFDRFLAERVFQPLGMQDIFFWPSNDAQRTRLASVYQRRDNALVLNDNPNALSGPKYFSGAGGLMATAETYAQFAMLLANRGELNGVRILSPRTVELMGSAFIPDTLPGRPAGEGFGLGVRVVTDPVARGTYLTKGSFGWSGVFGTHFWADPEKNLVGILVAQTSSRTLLSDFENAVLQAVLE